jgi:DNA-binding beta-propeller fold protein YncE
MNAAPIRKISGAATGLNLPIGLALDTAGTLYVTNQGDNSVTEYTAGADMNAAPIRGHSDAPQSWRSRRIARAPVSDRPLADQFDDGSASVVLGSVVVERFGGNPARRRSASST